MAKFLDLILCEIEKTVVISTKLFISYKNIKTVFNFNYQMIFIQILVQNCASNFIFMQRSPAKLALKACVHSN